MVFRNRGRFAEPIREASLSIEGATFTPSRPAVASCLNHAGRPAGHLCDACHLAFCGDCLVPIQGRRLCGPCKAQMARSVQRRRMTIDRKADEALVIAALGILCLPYILGPLAVFRARQALRVYADRPELPGRWKAVAAIAVAVLENLCQIAVWVWQSGRHHR